MDRILRLVCIITMMSSGQTQRGFYYQQESQVAFTNRYESPQSRSIQYTNQRNLENLSPRSQEARKRLDKIPQEATSLQNGTYKILNRLQINKRGALEDSIGDENDRVVFPGPTSKPNRNVKSKPDECKRKGYCDIAPNYPDELVNNIVAKLGEEVNNLQMDTLDDEVQIAQRLGGDVTEVQVPLCNINTTIIYPRSALDKNGQWHWILNPKDKPVQGFLAELCEDDSSSCHPIFSVPVGYKSSCTQKHVYRVAQAVQEGNNSTYKVQVKLPSCCSCTVTRTL